MNKKIYFSDNETLSDLSTALNDYKSGDSTISVVAAEDAFYIGSLYPFNHLYFKMGSTVNAEASEMTVSYWDGTTWRSMVNIVDDTASSGATLAQSGFVTFTPDKLYTWSSGDTNSSSGSGDSITGLDSVVVYDLFWLKVTFSADLTADMILSWVGQKFSNDNDLYSEYAEFNNSSLKTAIESGKTDWEEQHVAAGEVIIDDLVGREVIASGENILLREDLKRMAVSKVAEMIFIMRGEEYFDDADKARIEYRSRMNKKFVRADKNSNGRLDQKESAFVTGRLFR